MSTTSIKHQTPVIRRIDNNREDEGGMGYAVAKKVLILLKMLKKSFKKETQAYHDTKM